MYLSKPLGRRRVPRKGGAAALRKALHEGFDSLLIAMPSVDTLQLLHRLLPLMRPSTCFAVYSPWLQQLAEALQQMHVRKQGLFLQLHEGWMRPYQVVP